jgi:uncharacterized protein YbaA (DUF1428 family)
LGHAASKSCLGNVIRKCEVPFVHEADFGQNGLLKKKEASMARYVDGYVIPVKKKDVAAYKKMATLGRKIWMEHGALDYYECVGSVLKTQWGTPFTRAYKLKSNETLVFAFIIYKSKSQRDRITAKVHKDPRMNMEGYKMPFDMNRFSVGEFKTLVHT